MLQSIGSQGVGHNPETEQQICSDTSYDFEVCSPLFLLQDRMCHQKKKKRERERENVSYYLVLHLEVESRNSQFFAFLFATIDLHSIQTGLYTKISG